MIDYNNIKLISDDTLYLDKDDTFIAKKGKNYDLETIIEIAKEKTKNIISNKKIKKNDVYYYKNLNKLENKIIKNYKITPIIIGVTGTNGKTSTSTIIFSILKDLNKDVMLIGSNGVYYKNNHFKSRNTTPSKLSILYLINKYLNNNSFLVIELSSQSYNRIKNLKIDYLIFTNLSNEHLDYHKTMQKYFNAKLKIIRLLKDKKNLYINIDDLYGKKIAKKYKKAKKYSIKNITIIDKGPILFKNEREIISSKLSGIFNIYNIYSSYLLLVDLFKNKKEIIDSIAKIEKIEGRNNLYKYKDNFIVIDYAHTPESFNNILNHYYNLNHNNIYILFGFGGNKDKEKRSKMLEISNKYSNNIILTEDNSRYEPFIDILKSSLKVEMDNLVVIQNRKEAIKFAINKLEHNDYLLILGKGNEDYILKKGNIYKYSDYEEVKKWIQ